MSDFDLRRPDLGPLSSAAEAAELRHAVSELVSVYYSLVGSDPLAPIARAIARSMTEAGLTVHHYAPHDSFYRLGGVCPLPVQGGPDVGRAGVVVSWATHNLLLLDWDRHGTYAGTQQAMNTAIGGILRAFGYEAEPFGSGGAWLVTGRRHHDQGAGR
jgi:hypothetical protein